MKPQFFPRILPVLPAFILAFSALSPLFAETTQPAPTSGLVVQIGATDINLAQKFTTDNPVIFLALTQDSATELSLRQAFLAANIHGQATALTLPATNRLPLTDNLASLVIANLDACPTVTHDEILRILQPNGTATITSKGKTTTLEKPRPATFGNWPQYHFDATMSDVGDDRVAGPAYGIQWAAGPQDSSMQGVRVFNNIFVMPEGPRTNTYMAAREANTGLPLWKRKDLNSLSRYAFLMDADRVYLYPTPQNNRPAESMIALNARTGETVIAYSQGITFKFPDTLNLKDAKALNEASKSLLERAKDFQARLAGNVLLQVADGDLVALDAPTGKRLWAKSAPENSVYMHPVIDKDTLYIYEGPKAPSYSYTHWPNITATTLRAFNLKDGSPKWSLDWPADRPPAAVYNLTISNGKLASTLRQPATGKGKVTVRIIDAATGKENFFGTNDVFKGEIGGGHSSARAIAIGDRLWHTTIVSVGGSMSLSKPEDPASLDRSFSKLSRPVGCTAYRATSNWLFGSLTTYSLDGQTLVHTDSARTSCDVGAFPASGLSFITANHCFCQPYLSSSIAFHPRKFTGPENLNRLERGTASPAKFDPAESTAWPMFLKDNKRSAWSSSPLPKELKQIWTIKPGGEKLNPTQPLLAESWAEHWYSHGPITQPSIAQNIAVVALAHRQQIVGLDPATGAEKWRTSVDGRVDTAPTIHNGLVLAGTRNGWLYALNKDNGQLVWRFFAAPRTDRITIDAQLESPWPLFGTVNADDKGIYALAGRHTDADGGLFWYRLDITGKFLAQGRIGENELKPTTSGGGNPGKARITGANTPAVVSDNRLLLAGAHLERSPEGNLSPWFGLYDIKKSWEPEFWSLRHSAADTVVPGNQGMLSRVDILFGYKLPAYAFTQARLYAYHENDFVMVGGAPSLQHRGGDGNSVLRRMKKLPEITSTTKPNPKEPEKPIRKTAGSDEIWLVPESLPRGNGLTALASTPDTVLIGLEVTNRDRHKERAAMPYRLQLLNFSDGSLKQELPLPAPAIVGGIAIANSRIYVTTSDGSLTCFAAP